MWTLDLFIILVQMKIKQTGAVMEAKLKGRVRRVCPVYPSLPCWVAFGGQVEIMGDGEAGTYRSLASIRGASVLLACGLRPKGVRPDSYGYRGQSVHWPQRPTRASKRLFLP